MKKIIIFIMVCICLCGCENKEEILQNNKEQIKQHIKNNMPSYWIYSDDKINIDDDLNLNINAINTDNWSSCAIFARDAISSINNDKFKEIKIKNINFECYNNQDLTGKIILEDPKNTSYDNFEDKTKFYNEKNELIKQTILEGRNYYFEDYKDKCKEYNYKEIFRNSSNYDGKYATFTGEVIQVQESYGYYLIRINVTKDKYGYYDDTMLAYIPVTYFEGRILEEDILTIYGQLNGLETYESIFGESITIPRIVVEYVTLN